MRKLVLIFVASALTLLPTGLYAQAPTFMPVQGHLTDSGGQPIDGEVELKLSLYNDLTGGQALYQDTQMTQVEKGFFVIYIGGDTANPLHPDLFVNNSELYLGIRVGDDPEMTPRLVIGTVPYAGFAQFSKRAENSTDAEKLGGLESSAYRRTSEPVDWSDLAALGCAAGQVIKWNATHSTWKCAADNGASYRAGEGIHLDGTTIAADRTAIEGWTRSACYDSEAELTAVLDDNYLQPSERSTIEGWARGVCYDSEKELTAVLDDNYTSAWSDGDGQVRTDVKVGIGKDPSDTLDVNGGCNCAYFRTNSGVISMRLNQTGSAALSFGGRSVYIVKASWHGDYMEGTRAWWVLTHNDMNRFTGHPAIIEIGKTGPYGSRDYHHSDTLSLAVDKSLPYGQLRLSCKRTHGRKQTRDCRWSITRVAAH